MLELWEILRPHTILRLIADLGNQRYLVAQIKIANNLGQGLTQSIKIFAKFGEDRIRFDIEIFTQGNCTHHEAQNQNQEVLRDTHTFHKLKYKPQTTIGTISQTI